MGTYSIPNRTLVRSIQSSVVVRMLTEDNIARWMSSTTVAPLSIERGMDQGSDDTLENSFSLLEQACVGNYSCSVTPFLYSYYLFLGKVASTGCPLELALTAITQLPLV